MSYSTVHTTNWSTLYYPWLGLGIHYTNLRALATGVPLDAIAVSTHRVIGDRRELHLQLCKGSGYRYSSLLCISSLQVTSRGRAHTVSGTHTPTQLTASPHRTHTHSHSTHSALSCPKPSLVVGTQSRRTSTTQPSTLKGSYDWLESQSSSVLFSTPTRRRRF